MKQQSLKEFLEDINPPTEDQLEWNYECGVLEGQYELAQEILGKYFTERNFE